MPGPKHRCYQCGDLVTLQSSSSRNIQRYDMNKLKKTDRSLPVNDLLDRICLHSCHQRYIDRVLKEKSEVTHQGHLWSSQPFGIAYSYSYSYSHIHTNLRPPKASSHLHTQLIIFFFYVCIGPSYYSPCTIYYPYQCPYLSSHQRNISISTNESSRDEIIYIILTAFMYFYSF